ncbi:SDR family oxidoreductase [uncultured Deinococcus sp.]|uniref:SDR family oxidoreductase n=1 Tax=uncultured Deinococcus sp. TaxID=158789 RepID=UPI0025D40720|nr:SDR family oxidoreductase [uncultured Deinococcus sp.]
MTQEKKVALVTGANKGIGTEIARQLGQHGYTVLIGARDAQRGEAAAAALRTEGLDAHPLVLDVTDAASVQAAANHINGQFGRLDALVNNAGVLLDSMPPSTLPVDVLRATFETNVFGVVQVIQMLLPLLRATPNARIVNMGSGMGSLTLTSDAQNMRSGNPMIAYAPSKAALHAVTVQFANELRTTDIKVNAADPGYVATDMTGQQGFNSLHDGALPAVRLATLPDDGPTAGFFDITGSVPW